LTSSNATTWTSVTNPSTTNLHGVAYGNGLFVTVGANGTILISATASSWQAQPSGVSLKLNSIAFANGTFVAVGEKGTILTSSNALSWSQLPVMNGVTLYAVTPY